MGIGESAHWRGEQDVAHQGQLETTGGGHPVDTDDDGPVKSGHGRGDVVLPVDGKDAQAALVSPMALRSSPAQKARPAPVRMTARIGLVLQIPKRLHSADQQCRRQGIHATRAD